MNCSYEDVVDVINKFKLSFDENIEKYNNEIKPTILNLEKQFTLNNYIPHLTTNDLDDLDDLNNLDDLDDLDDLDNFIDNSIYVQDYNTLLQPNNETCEYYSLNSCYKINKTNILNVLKLNKYEDLKLYFDDEYKKNIIKYDTVPDYFYGIVDLKNLKKKVEDDYYGKGKFVINTVIYTNYNFIIELKLSNIKYIKQYEQFDRKKCCDKLINFKNIMYGNEINFNFEEFVIYDKYENSLVKKMRNIIEVKFVNTTTNEEFTYVYNKPFSGNNKLFENVKPDENKLHEFINKCEKEINLKILTDYKKTKSSNETHKSFNQTDTNKKLSSDTIISEKNNIIDEQQKTINKLKKQIFVMNKKYEHLDKLYNNLLESKF